MISSKIYTYIKIIIIIINIYIYIYIYIYIRHIFNSFNSWNLDCDPWVS